MTGSTIGGIMPINWGRGGKLQIPLLKIVVDPMGGFDERLACW